MSISRREWLVGAGVLSAIGLVVVADTSPVRRVLGWTGEDGVVPDIPPYDVAVSRVHSASRGRDVDLVRIAPLLHDQAELPVCVVLHDREGSARSMVELGLPHFLAAYQDEWGSPFMVVAVDGGDEHWTGPSMTMLVEELPKWLDDLGLRRPRAALGISTGGFGALALAVEHPLDVIAVLSPTLFGSWEDAQEAGGFPDEKAWQDYEPLRHVDAIDSATEMSVWCGEEDRFHDTAVEFAGKANAVVDVDHGLHDTGYWRRVLPDAIFFIGDRLHG